MRFPQALAIGPDGSVYVADQGSHVVQVFGPDGVFRREVGIAGSKPGQLSARRRDRGRRRRLAAGGRRREPHRPLRRQRAAHELVGRDRQRRRPVPLRRRQPATRAAAGGGLAVVGRRGLRRRHRQRPRPALHARRRPRRRDRAARPAGQPARDRGARHAAARGRRPAPPARRLRHRRAPAARRSARTARAPASSTSPTAWPPTRSGRVFVADDLNHRVVRFSSGPVYPYKGRWGSYGTAPGPARLSARARGRRGGQRLRRQHRQRPHRRLRQGRRAAALVRHLGPRGGAVRRAGRRRRRRRRHPRGDRLGQRPRASCSTPTGRWPRPGARRRRGRRSSPTRWPSPSTRGGNAYVLDRRRSRIVVFARATGLPVRTIGSPGQRPGPAAQPLGAGHRRGRHDRRWPTRATSASRASAPAAATSGATTGVGDVRGIAVTPDGSRTYLSTTSHRIDVYDPSGSEVDEFGGQGSKLGKLESPGQIALDAAGNLWVADRGNNRIQEFGPGRRAARAFGVRGVGLGEFIHPSGVSHRLPRDADRHRQLTTTASSSSRWPRRPRTACAAAARRSATRRRRSSPRCPAPLGPQVSLRVLRTAGLVSTRNAAAARRLRHDVHASPPPPPPPRRPRRRASTAA